MEGQKTYFEFLELLTSQEVNLDELYHTTLRQWITSMRPVAQHYS
ncbi:MAG: hypothetical protein ACMUEM_03345 [Flavobacteriales bacterium AspAUS03]